MWNTLQMNKGDLTVCPITYQMREKKCEKITSHLRRKLSIFHVLFLLCIVSGWPPLRQTTIFSEVRDLFLKTWNNYKDNDNTMTWLFTEFCYLGLVQMLWPFVEFLTGAEKLDKQKRQHFLLCADSEISVISQVDDQPHWKNLQELLLI